MLYVLYYSCRSLYIGQLAAWERESKHHFVCIYPFITISSLDLKSTRSCLQRKNWRPKGRSLRRRLPRKLPRRKPTKWWDSLKVLRHFPISGRILRWVTNKVSVSNLPVQVEETMKEDIAVIQVDYKPDPSLPRAIILDLSAVNFLDTVGVKTLRRVRTVAPSHYIQNVLTVKHS